LGAPACGAHAVERCRVRRALDQRSFTMVRRIHPPEDDEPDRRGKGNWLAAGAAGLAVVPVRPLGPGVGAAARPARPRHQGGVMAGRVRWWCGVAVDVAPMPVRRADGETRRVGLCRATAASG
jgi:hypothetical protein